MGTSVAEWGIGSPIYQQELQAANAGVMQFYNAFAGQRAAQQGGPMAGAQVMQQAVPAHPGAPVNSAWKDEDLVGAATYWGLPEDQVRQMPREAVIEYVNQKRQSAGGQVWQDNAGQLMKGLGLPVAMAGIGAGEAITGGLQHLPGIGDWISRQSIVKQADLKLRQMEEAVRSNMPEFAQNPLSVANVGGNLAAMWYPGSATWSVAGKIGEVMPLVSKATPIGRAAFQGGLSAYLLAGGTKEDDPNPWLHRAEVVGMGAALGAAAPALGMLSKRIMDRYVSPQVVEAVKPTTGLGAMEIPANLGEQRPSFEDTFNNSPVRRLRILAEQGDAQAQAMLQYMGHDLSDMEIPVGGSTEAAAPTLHTEPGIPQGPAYPYDPYAGMPPEVRTQVGAPMPPEAGQAGGPVDWSPKIGWEPDGALHTPDVGLRPEPTAYLPQGGLAGEGPALGEQLVARSEALASQLNKAGTVIQSSEFPAMAGQTSLDDMTVIHAAYADNPGGINLIQGIEDPAVVAANLGPNAKFAVRNGRLDVIMGDSELASYAAKEYETFGRFSGQRVITPDGLGGTIRGIDLNGTAYVQPFYGEQFVKVAADELHPFTSSPQVTEAPHLWDQFMEYANARTVETQAAMGGALQPSQLELMQQKNLANWMEDYLDAVGASDPGNRSRLREYFNLRWVGTFKALAPAEVSLGERMSAEAGQVGVEVPAVQNLDRHAAAKGFRVIPVNENHWIVQDAAPTANASNISRLEFGSREAAEEWVKTFNRELPDITPPSTVPLEVAAQHPTEPMQTPNTNAAAPKVLTNAVKELEAAEGGAPPAGEPPVEVLEGEANPGRANNRWIQSQMRWQPARRLWSRLDEGVNEHTGQDIGLGRDWFETSNAITRHHNDQNPWFDQLSDILAPVRSKFLNDGTWTRIYEIMDPAERAAAIARHGMTAKEAASFDAFDGLMQRLFPETGLDEIRQIPRYISHISQRQSVPETLNNAWEGFQLGPTTTPFYEYARTGNLNMRELHPGVLGETYIRAVTWMKNMAPLWDQQVAKYTQLAQSEDPAIAQVGHLYLQQLRLVKFGYQAQDDIALDALHGFMQKMFGDGVTRQQAREIFSFGMNSAHSGMLGFRPSVIARDIFQFMLALPRAGLEVGQTYLKWATDSAFRKALWDEAVRDGAVSLQMPRRAAPGAFMGDMEKFAAVPPEMLEAGQAPEIMSSSNEYNGLWRGGAKISMAIRDMLPDWLRDTRDTFLHPMYLYGKQSELTRALVYSAGKTKALNAIGEYRMNMEKAPELAEQWMEKLMGDSAARTYDPSWQREFKRLVSLGTVGDEQAAKFMGHQLADATQFKYGQAESPWAGKSMTGRLALQFGNYPMQYFQFLRESLANGTGADKAKLLGLVAATFGALDASSKATGWNFRWMNPFAGLGFTGGPLINTINTVAQGARSLMQVPSLGDAQQPNYNQMGAAMGTLGSAALQLTPMGGIYKTAQGIGGAMGSPDPTNAFWRHMITGETGAAPDINRMLLPQAEASFQRSLQPQYNPVRGSGTVGLPPGVFPQQVVVDPPMLQNPQQIPAGIPASGSTLPGGYGVSPGGIQP